MDTSRKCDVLSDSTSVILKAYRQVKQALIQESVKISSSGWLACEDFKVFAENFNPMVNIPVKDGKFEITDQYVQDATMDRVILLDLGLPSDCIPKIANDATAPRKIDGKSRVDDDPSFLAAKEHRRKSLQVNQELYKCTSRALSTSSLNVKVL